MNNNIIKLMNSIAARNLPMLCTSCLYSLDQGSFLNLNQLLKFINIVCEAICECPPEALHHIFAESIKEYERSVIFTLTLPLPYFICLFK